MSDDLPEILLQEIEILREAWPQGDKHIHGCLKRVAKLNLFALKQNQRKGGPGMYCMLDLLLRFRMCFMDSKRGPIVDNLV